MFLIKVFFNDDFSLILLNADMISSIERIDSLVAKIILSNGRCYRVFISDLQEVLDEIYEDFYNLSEVL